MKKLCVFLTVMALCAALCVGAFELTSPEEAIETGVFLPAAAPAETSQYGELLFRADFTGATYWTNTVYKSSDYTFTVSNDGGSGFNPEIVAGLGGKSDSDRAVRIKKAGQFTFYRIRIVNPDDTNQALGYGRPGKYTFKYDVYYPTAAELGIYDYTSVTPKTQAVDARNRSEAMDTTVYDGIPGEWKTITATYTVVTQAEAEAAGVTFDSVLKGNKRSPAAHILCLSALDRTPQFTANDGSGTKSFNWYALDNIEIWYEESPRVIYDFSLSPVPASAVTAVSGSFNPNLLDFTGVEGEDLPVLAADGYDFYGWANEYGTQEVVEAGLNHLYPMFTQVSDGTIVSADGAKEYKAGTATDITFTATKNDVTWHADFGTTGITGFTSTYDGHAIITLSAANKKAGVITVWTTDNDAAGAESNRVQVSIHSAQEVVPGLNLFNGNNTVCDYEDGFTWGLTTNGNTYTASGSIAVADVPDGLSGNDSLKALKYSFSNLTYASMYWYTPLEAGRNYRFSGKLYRTVGRIGRQTDNVLYILNGGAHQSFQLTTAEDAWSPFSVDIQNANGVSKVYYQHLVSTAGAVSGDLYLDDVSFVPFYKINYHNADGTVTTVQVLADSFEPASSASFIDADAGRALAGWSLTEGGEAVSSVALENADIDLYPAYETLGSSPVLVACDGSLALHASGTLTLTDPQNVATLTDNGDGNYTLAGTGKNGRVTVGGITVQFYGSTSWRPGLNVVDGTTGTFGFDFGSDNAKFFHDNSAPFVSGEEIVLPGSSSNNKWPSVFITKVVSPKIGIERPIAVSFKYKGNITNLWVMNNWAGNGQKYGTISDELTITEEDGWFDAFYFGTQESATKAETSCLMIEPALKSVSDTLYVDDVSVMPAYKVTYLDNADGTTVLAEDYVLFDAKGNVLTAITPDFTLEGLEQALSVSLTKDGPAVNSVPAAYEDVTFYVTLGNNAPITVNRVSIRTSGVGGMRFGAFVTASQKVEASAYGFMVALKRDLPTDANGASDFSSLAFDGATFGETSGTLACGARFVYAFSYDPANDIDKIYSMSGSSFGEGVNYENAEPGFYFTGVVVGMNGYAQYTTDLVARPFIKIGDVYYYGAPMVRNIYDVAKALQAAGDDSDYIAAIVASAGN